MVDVIHCPTSERATLQFSRENYTLPAEEVAGTQFREDAQDPTIRDQGTKVESSTNRINFACICMNQHAQVHRQGSLLGLCLVDLA